ncbi:unnamed protein product [Ilex paraguariensis]|uniref:SET domain-containing protein n=1 Tax=Ilex paraguariensis TaxID=185542 RepID=A0ABC8QS83_9AQUA
MRAFKRWMKSQSVECSDALDLIDDDLEGISVRTVCDLHEGDLVATIPKRSCLTIKTSGARRLIEDAGLEGYLGLSVSLMYERSLGEKGPWFEYFQLLPESECIPLMWTLDEVDSLLSGTELHKGCRGLVCSAMATRRMRAFKRWMKSQSVECSDALDLIDDDLEGISVRTVCDLHEGDLVATIPKRSCLTIKTSGARRLIEDAGLEGYLGLSVSLMYERSLGEKGPWFEYFQLLPESECIPLMWTLDEVDSLLSGTELHKIVKEDKALIYEDWKECILPLTASAPLVLNPDYFGVEQYLAAKSLIASRSFEIDNYHGFGMVPLADLFNHKTGAEDVHFTSVSSQFQDDDGADDNNNDDYHNTDDDKPRTQNSCLREHFSNGCDMDSSSTLRDDPTVLEMVIVKDVKAGSEVFNTYGFVGNAALLHRYGFTEPDNPYDIVNLDLELVLQWSSSLFSNRHSRMRLSLWRKMDYSGCVSQNSEYFEISFVGEPQVELLVLLYIILLPEEACDELGLLASTVENSKKSKSSLLLEKGNILFAKCSKLSKNLLLTKDVCNALLSLADIRESCYELNSVEDDIKAMNTCCPIKERKLYHSLMLRASERRILEKLRSYASADMPTSSELLAEPQSL